MPVPELAAIVAVLSTVTLPKIPDSGGFGILDGDPAYVPVPVMWPVAGKALFFLVIG
jgi:hypothetical protein